jgi:hypothetical protein
MARFSHLSSPVQAQRVHDYWRHTPTGQLWAVRFVDGEVEGACGPLDRRAVAPLILPSLPFDFRDVCGSRDGRPEFSSEPFGPNALDRPIENFQSSNRLRVRVVSADISGVRYVEPLRGTCSAARSPLVLTR